MKISAQIQVVIELLDQFFESLLPFDYIMAKFFRNNKYIGAFDRREIAEISYAIFRNYEKLKYFVPSNINLSRGLVLAFLRFNENFLKEDDDIIGKILNIFSGKNYAPLKCEKEEREFLKNINVKAEIPHYAKYNYPLWSEKYFKRRFEKQSEFEAEMLAIQNKSTVDLRVNNLKSTEEEVAILLSESQIEFKKLKFAKSGFRIQKHIGRNHKLISEGLVEIQDEGSQIIAELCGAKPNDVVVDLCAGAGGKTLALADCMQNKGNIFALDTALHRLENAKLRLKRAGVHNVFCHSFSNKWLKRHEGKIDIVLVDAPCSGSGTWRRNPDMRARLKESDIIELSNIQYSILETAKKLLKQNGRLIYSTCSLFKEEDEDQIEKFLSNNKDMELQNIIPTRYRDVFSGSYLNLATHKFDTDGFFAALMIKK